MAELCSNCETKYFKFFCDFYESNQQSIIFLRSHRVLPSSVIYQKCENPCAYREDK